MEPQAEGSGPLWPVCH